MPETITSKKPGNSGSSPNERKYRNLWEQLEKLRWHFIRILMVVTGLTILAFINRHLIFDQIILAPREPDFPTNLWLCRVGKFFSIDSLCFGETTLKIINVSMSGQFLTHLYISAIAGMVVAFPYLLYEIWSYLAYIFNVRRNYGIYIIFTGTFLFVLGILFSYYLIVPFTVNFLGTYSVSSSVQNSITLSSYISTIGSLVLGVGVVFELPFLSFFLTKFGIITPGFLRRKRKYMIVAIFVGAAVITPPDVVSQLMVSIPLLLLYEVSIWVSVLVGKRK